MGKRRDAQMLVLERGSQKILWIQWTNRHSTTAIATSQVVGAPPPRYELSSWKQTSKLELCVRTTHQVQHRYGPRSQEIVGYTELSTMQ
jgi:hypothetical protein